MKPKKNPKFDLERKRGLFLQIGLALSLLIVLGAFEYKTHEKTPKDLGDVNFASDFEQEIENTFRDKKPLPPPPPPPIKIEILPDNKKQDESIIEGTESSEDIGVFPDEPESYDEDEFFFSVEEMPRFVGCNADKLCTDSKIMEFIIKNIKYPAIARENNINGRVFISFVVDKLGKVTNVKVIGSVDKYLDDEAIRVVKSLPDFKPGKQRGKAVKVQYNIPIRFSLD